MLILWCVQKPPGLEGLTMSNLESRLAKLEAVQETPHREYSDAERAVRCAYLLERGGPDADKLRALLANVDASQEHDHVKP